MRIALIADEDPGWGGIGTYTGVLGSALRDLGHDVVLVLRGWEGDRTEELGGLTMHRVMVPEPSWRRGTVACVSRLWVTRESLVFSARVARLLATLAPDVVEAPEFHAPGLLAASCGRLRRRGAPRVVVRLHAPSFLTAALAGEERDLDGRITELAEATSVHWASAISAPSAAVAELVHRRWRVPLRRIAVVPNPIDDDLFTPAIGGQGHPHGDQATPGSILVVGRVERAKGQDVLLEALPAIRAIVPEAHVRIVGADGGLSDPLARRARDLGVAEAISFDGARPREELPAIYRSAAVCVVPSRFEAFPYTCVEAMACGRPVVASRVGGLPEVVTDRTDGLLVAPDAPSALAAAVSSLLLDADARQRVGDAARARVETSFAAGTVGARTARLYEDLLR